jgi:DNA-binding transcriptional ArsR family regulator
MRKSERPPAARADLIAHPVRLRIILALAGQQLTTHQIAAFLPDVPQASLYRNIHRLAEAGILRVVRETPVRGAIQRVYALVEGAGGFREAELASASREDHLRYFTIFFATMLSSLRSYLQQEVIDPRADGLTCRAATVYVSDAEYRRLLEQVGELLEPAMTHPRTPGRRQRIIGLTAIPARRDQSAEPDDDEE